MKENKQKDVTQQTTRLVELLSALLDIDPENVQIDTGYENQLDDNLTFGEYQSMAVTTAKDTVNLSYATLGLAGEVGELTSIFAKAIRDKDGRISAEDRTKIAKEAGDCLWFLSILCTLLDLSFDEVARMNLTKLADRKARGKIGGSGDDR